MMPNVLAELIAERGATIPRGDLRETLPPLDAPTDGPPSSRVLAELREDRL